MIWFLGYGGRAKWSLCSLWNSVCQRTIFDWQGTLCFQGDKSKNQTTAEQLVEDKRTFDHKIRPTQGCCTVTASKGKSSFWEPIVIFVNCDKKFTGSLMSPSVKFCVRTYPVFINKIYSKWHSTMAEMQKLLRMHLLNYLIIILLFALVLFRCKWCRVVDDRENVCGQ